MGGGRRLAARLRAPRRLHTSTLNQQRLVYISCFRTRTPKMSRAATSAPALYRSLLRLAKQADAIAETSVNSGRIRSEETLGAAITARARKGFREGRDAGMPYAQAECEALRRICADVHMKKHPPPAAAFERLKKPTKFGLMKKIFGF